MKVTLALISFSLISLYSFGQADTTQIDTNATYRIIFTDDTEMIAQIISSDARELYIKTKDGRKIYIPQFKIDKLEIIKPTDFDRSGNYIGDDRFATRYFLTTNGLPLKKGDHYVQWNLYGPDFQFSVTDKIGAGIMTTWIGFPIVGNVKYTVGQTENTQFAVGLLGATGSWTFPDFVGLLPFATVSFGDRKANMAFSGGYGSIWTGGDHIGSAMVRVGGMARVGSKISLVFDSFVLLPAESSAFAVIIPGIRWHKSDKGAFQFGFGGVSSGGDLSPLPIPMVQWFRTL